MSDDESGEHRDFIRNIIAEDLAENRTESLVTRFPPEPNGYLHIGHAKSICLNFGVADEFDGLCNLRFDDTNPAKEEQEYIDAIEEDIKWLGYSWSGEPRYASDYFDQLYEWAELLIGEGKAYVDDLSADEIREYRGTLTEPGRASPSRSRSRRNRNTRSRSSRSTRSRSSRSTLLLRSRPSSTTTTSRSSRRSSCTRRRRQSSTVGATTAVPCTAAASTAAASQPA